MTRRDATALRRLSHARAARAAASEHARRGLRPRLARRGLAHARRGARRRLVRQLPRRARRRTARMMRAATPDGSCPSADTGAFACLDFMALRMPVDRRTLAAHPALSSPTGSPACCSRRATRRTPRRRSRRFSPSEKRVAMGNAGAHARAARLHRDGDDRRIRARGERRRRPDASGRNEVTAPNVDEPSDAQPTFAHRAEYAALRGAVAAMERLSFDARRRASASGSARSATRRSGSGAPSSSGSSRAAFPEQIAAEIERIARAAYGHLGRTSDRDGDAAVVQRRRRSSSCSRR